MFYLKAVSLVSSHLLLAHEVVVDRILEKLLSHVVLASPSPHVGSVRIVACSLHDADTDRPDDNGDDENSAGKDCGPESHPLCFAVSTFPIPVHDCEGEDKLDTGNDENHNLRPLRGIDGPGTQVVALSHILGCEENGKGGSDESEDDQAAGAVDAAKNNLR